MSSKAVKILNIAGTPLELYLLSSTALLLKKIQPECKFDVIISQKLLNTFTPSEEVLKIYENRFVTELPGLSPSSRNLPENLRRGWRFRQYLKRMNLNYDYMFIGSYNEFFANMLYRHLPKKVKTIIFTPYANYLARKVEPQSKKKRLLNFTFSLCDFLFGYSQTKNYWSPETGRAVGRIIKKLPNHTIILNTDKKNIETLPENHFALPFPFIALTNLFKAEKSSKPAILVAGERTPIYPGWNEQDETMLKQVFDFLRNKYGDHELVYRPRPGLTNFEQIRHLVEGFTIYEGNEPMEETLIQKKYAKVISIKSTVSKLATWYGIPGYVLYPMFNMPENFRQTMADDLFTDSEYIVKIKKVEDLDILKINNALSENFEQRYSSVIFS